MDTKGFRPRALGEIAIRCADTRKMADFYENVIGLQPLSGNHRDGILFFKIAEGVGGHKRSILVKNPLYQMLCLGWPDSWKPLDPLGSEGLLSSRD